MDTVDMIIRSSTSFYNDLKQDKMVDIVRGNIVIQTFHALFEVEPRRDVRNITYINELGVFLCSTS